MDIVKMPNMGKKEFDRLIREEYIARIVFQGEKYPYIAPFLYVFDGKYMYFLSTKYGKKIEYFNQSPYVSVEVDKYNRDLSNYAFAVLSGRLVEVNDERSKKDIRDLFVDMIKERNLSDNIMIALGHSAQDPTKALAIEERNFIWKLVDVRKIKALKMGTRES